MDTVNIVALAQSAFVFVRNVSIWGTMYPLSTGKFRSYMRVSASDPVVYYSWASDGSCPGTITYLTTYATGSFTFAAQPAAGNQLQLGSSLVTFQPASAASAVTIAPSAIVTISIAAPGIVSWTGHGLPVGTPVVFSTTGALPTGLTAGTTYYVSLTDYGANSFAVAATQAGAIAGSTITTSGTQSGFQTCAAPTTILWPSHGLVAGEAVQFFTTGALPTGLTAGTAVYVLASLLTSGSFQVATAPGGTPIATSGAQSGAQTALGGNTVMIGPTIEATLANCAAFCNVSKDSQISQVITAAIENTLNVTAASPGPAANTFVIASLFAAATSSDTQLDGGGGMLTFTAPAAQLEGFAGQSFVYDCRWEPPSGDPIYIFGGTMMWNQAVTR
jgi:hypothetical protein